jgi:flagellin
MALGVLNNLSAIYAENNLNNTNNSLQTVLQQLSSGSKINSGADDAAGLSLVNGLQANQTALKQSETNATEGAGLLHVADGALSQVTNLLNRAITLATEASNGTLNSTQGAAANQEYQSILAEINNIGSTTTYNQQQVFAGNTIAIYTGDSSTTGSSIDNLYIRTLSSANVGDSNGAISYSSGANNVFIDLSNGGKNAAVTDGLGGTSTTIDVSYLTKGTGGSTLSATAAITVGAGTTYANSAQGLISAINNAGLGLNATFATATQAGSSAVKTAQMANATGGGGTDTGIEISGAGLGTGTDGAGEIGTLTARSDTDTLGGTLTIVGSDGKSHTINLGTANSTDTLANLASTINAAGYGVTATYSAANKNITFTSANPAVTVSGANITDTSAQIVNAPQAFGPASVAGGAKGAIGYVLGAVSVANSSDILAGNVNIAGADGLVAALNNLLGTPGSTDTLANLANTINTYSTAHPTFGVNAVLNSAGTTMTLTETAAVANAGLNTLTGSITSDITPVTTVNTALTGAPTTGNTAYSSQVGALAIGGIGGSATDTIGGTLTIGSYTIALGVGTSTNTLKNLAATIDAGNYGVTATYNATTKDIVFTSANSALTIGGSPTDANFNSTIATSNAPADFSAYYSTGITGTVTDSSTNGGTTNTGMTLDTNGAGGTATVSYSDGAGEDLSSTDLTTQVNAEVALNDLNLAISAAAALDGYVGGQINTLDAISQVMSTQEENVVSAQNAIQATDYASATSNMSKYEILSQTGIAALAQANSVQQEVTKLLQ